MTADAVGGVWQYATDLAAALLPLGIETTLALIGPAPAGLAPPAGVQLVATGLPLDWLADGPEAVRDAGHAVAAMARGFDLVQLNTPTLGLAAYPVPVLAVAHGCLGTWWEAVEGTPVPAAMAWQVALARDGFHTADLVVAPTAAFAAEVQRRYALPALPVAVHNGRTPLVTGAPAAAHDVAFTAGRLWDRAKNVGVLDAAAARLSIPFVAAGPLAGPQGEAAAPRHLHTLGRIDEAKLAEQLRARPVFATSALFEPFGLAVLEAAQTGCPLVLSDIATFRELWDGAALFVPADDAAGFAAAIGQVIGDAGLRDRLGAAAAERAARYTPAACAAAMAAFYRRLAQPSRRAAA